jgi:DNA-binding MarR family transcriptional regulator
MKGGHVNADDLAERVVAFVRAFGLHRPHETPCGKPIPVAEAHALMDLARLGPMSHGHLAQRLRLEKSTVSRIVRQLEKRRWVERDTASHDRRVVFVRLTKRGKAATRDLAQARRGKFSRLLTNIPSAQRTAVIGSLSTLVHALERPASGTASHRKKRTNVRAAGRFLPR